MNNFLNSGTFYWFSSSFYDMQELLIPAIKLKGEKLRGGYAISTFNVLGINLPPPPHQR